MGHADKPFHKMTRWIMILFTIWYISNDILEKKYDGCDGLTYTHIDHSKQNYFISAIQIQRLLDSL